MLEHLNRLAETPRRVVVIGGGGFVGSSIAHRLRREAIEVATVTRRDCDLLAPEAPEILACLLKPGDSIVFVSAVAPAKTVEQFALNIRMAEAMCAALAKSEVGHLLYISSDAVYADDANPVTEQSPLAPSTLHGMMHAARELMLKSASAAPAAMLRPTLIYGASDPHNGYGPNRFRRQAAKGEPIAIFGEGEERRDHVLVEDVAELALLILQRRSRGALNAVTGIATSFHDIAQLVARQFPGGRVVSVPRPGPRPHLLHRHFDVTHRLKAFPEFHPVPLAEGLERARQEA